MKKIVGIILATVCAIGLQAEVYSGSWIQPNEITYSWSLDSETGLLTIDGSGAMMEFGNISTLPPWIEYRNLIKNVEIADEITVVGSFIFDGCAKIESIKLPAELTYIGNRAFQNCGALKAITIPEKVTEIITSAFVGCGSLTTVVWNAEAATSAYPFDEVATQITSFTIGDNVRSLPSKLMQDMSVTELVIPENITHITSIFRLPYCTTVHWNATNYTDYEYSWFDSEYSDNITTFTFGDKVEIIPASICRGLTSITSIELPASVKEIGRDAFSECSGITAITIPDGCTTISEHAFARTNLTEIVIPESVTSISRAPFNYCTNLKKVVWNVTTHEDFGYGSQPFNECSAIEEFILGDNVERIPQYLFCGLENLTSLTIPENVTTLKAYTFQGSGVKDVVWNARNFLTDYNDVLNPFWLIGKQIETFTLGEAVESIPNYLCYGMEKITEITIPKNVQSIGKEAFGECISLQTVTSLSVTPPVVDATRNSRSFFSELADKYLPQTNVPLYVVSTGAKEAYENSDWAELFGDIRTLNYATYEVWIGTSQGGTVSYEVAEGGMTDDTPEDSNRIRVYENATITLTATPLAGFTFDQFSDGSINPVLNLQPTQDMKIYPIFRSATCNDF